MRTRLIVLLLCTTGAMSAADSTTPPAPRPRLTAAMRLQAAQLSLATRESDGFGRPSDDTPAAAQQRVVGRSHGMLGRVDAPQPGSRPFTLREGGTYWDSYGKVFTKELLLQYDPSNGGWDLFRISW